MNKVVDEITAAPCDCHYPCATQPVFGHLGHEGTATFTDYAGGSRLIFLFEASIHLLIISDCEQCCMDNIRDLIIIYKRHLQSFIGHGGISCFAHILYYFLIFILLGDYEYFPTVS